MEQAWLFWLGLGGLVILLLAVMPRLLTRLARALSRREGRHREGELGRRLTELNRRRRVQGLGPFPSLDEFEALAASHARELMPDGAGTPRTEPYYDGTLDITFGGVVVLGDVQPSPDLPGVYHLGEFIQHTDSDNPFLATIGTGHTWRVHCGIIIYYGSFLETFADAPRAEVLAELRHTVAHELRHLLDEEEHVPLRNSLAWSDVKHHHRLERWLADDHEATP